LILNTEVLTIFILNILFLFFASIAFYLSIKIYLKWDINSTTTTQYTLEKQSVLTATIIKYIFALKLPLFLFFIFTLDNLSNLITGAMCAAGVVDATPYGTYLFILKILNIYIFGFWLVLHNLDTKDETLKYTKIKFGLFIFIFLFLLAEIILESIMFNAIDISKMVSCCGVIYSSTSTSLISYIFTLSNTTIILIFYGNFILLYIFYILKKQYLFSLFNLFFLIVSIISLIAFFGTYIYELPTHHCPFCYLQRDYYYVGYFIYILLFTGTFNGLLVGFLNTNNKNYFKSSLLFNTLFVLLVSFYPIFYYMKNGVWL